MYKAVIKRLLGDKNDTDYRKVEESCLSYHDRCHLQVAALSPILMCGQMVDGVSGVVVPEHGMTGKQSQYHPFLDEARVAIHQLIKERSPISLMRYLYWAIWLIRMGDNPIRITLSHIRTMR